MADNVITSIIDLNANYLSTSIIKTKIEEWILKWPNYMLFLRNSLSIKGRLVESFKMKKDISGKHQLKK